jgi:hypothetical protein
MDHFVLHSDYQPTGDQPQAIAELVKGFKEGNQFWKFPFYAAFKNRMSGNELVETGRNR